MKTVFQRRPQVREQQVGKERMLFDESGDAVHVLNTSAAFIWDTLKTPVSTAEIEDLLRKEYDLSAVPNVPAIITGVIDELKKKNLVESRTVGA